MIYFTKELSDDKFDNFETSFSGIFLSILGISNNFDILSSFLQNSKMSVPAISAIFSARRGPRPATMPPDKKRITSDFDLDTVL